ncbi:ABC transporter ATP-binding protein [Lapidilactobacillus gannanensis]|uniref:ABC transporter ATP-binding protein n=1 Tax=Lapidilactobacillus gannanensis TaxID=2486002 RepID=A0ABW4BLT4_9LACO|nr:ABC transporter ATP-binding protein [Lapidilactobacillus gannanensis]
MTIPVLEIKQVSKKFGHYQALTDIDLTINRGDIFGLIGENGAGKTTLMRLITQLSPLQQGQITLLGETGSHYQQALSRIGAIIESPAFFKKLTVAENLKIFAIQHGLSGSQLIDQTLAFVGLAEKANTRAGRLSLGQKQRLGLGLAILPQPDFLILDEPINGLDPAGIIEFRQLLKRLNQERQTTILISSHILTELYQVSTRFGFIHHGHLIQQLTKAALDEANQSGVLITTPMVASAARILDQAAYTALQVIDDQHLLVQATAADPAKINQILVSGGVAVTAINQRTGSLEQYYTALLRKEGGK